MIQSGKTTNSLSRVQSPSTFCFNFNPKHYSSKGESIKILKDVLLTYVAREKKLPNLVENHSAFLIMDVFKGQTILNVLIFLHHNNISSKTVPAKPLHAK